jgi:hypothetical protein
MRKAAKGQPRVDWVQLVHDHGDEKGWKGWGRIGSAHQLN